MKRPKRVMKILKGISFFTTSTLPTVRDLKAIMKPTHMAP
jgi:hypothetical protein